MASPTDGRITSQPLFTGSLSGSEFLILVSPGNASQGINYKMNASTLASYILPNGGTGLPLVANGPNVAPSFQALNIATTANVTGLLALANGGLATASLGVGGVVIGQGTAAPITAAPLSVATGGIGTASLATNAVVIGQGLGALITASAASGQVLAANNGTPVFSGAPILSTSLAIGVGTTLGSGLLLGVNLNSATLPNVAPFAGEQVVAAFAAGAGTTTGVGAVSFGNFSGFVVARAQGTAGGMTAVQSGQIIGVFDAHGYDGTTWSGGVGQMRISATENYNATSHGGNVSFWSTPNGTTTVVQATIINQDQSLIHFGTAIINRNVATTNVASTNVGTGTVLRLVGADGTATRAELNSFGTFGAVSAMRADGTGGGISALAANDVIFALQGGGYDNATWSSSAVQMQFLAAETWNATSHGAFARIAPTPSGTTTAIETIRFQGSGGISIGTTTDPGSGAIIMTGKETLLSGSALTTAGAAVLLFSSVTNFGIFCGTGNPQGILSAGTGSLFIRNDGASATTRLLVNTNGASTWTGFTSQA